MQHPIRQRIRNLLLVLLVASLILLFRHSISPDQVQGWVENAGFWGPLIFLVCFLLGGVLALPSSLFMLASGALFGPVMGSVYSVIGASASALLTFLLTRHFLADWVRANTGGWRDRLITGVERQGWKYVAVTRLIPVFPFNLVSYAFGLTRIATFPYLLTTAITIIPGSILFAYLGYAGFTSLSAWSASQ